MNNNNQPDPSETPTNISDVIGDRLATWQAAVEMELQELLTEAASLREIINSAKTQTKRAFYEKKFDAVKKRIIQMTVAHERLTKHEQELKAEKEDVSAAAE